MELPVFLIGLVVVLVLLARGRVGGRSRTPNEERDFEAHRPIGYGVDVAPPDTPPTASANAPWFGRDRSGSNGGGSAAE